MTDNDREALREEIDRAMRPAVDKVLADAKRPYQRMVFWLLAGYAVLVIASIVQWLVMP